jgi:steroid delta-isomerase-like uncharacterized protein
MSRDLIERQERVIAEHWAAWSAHDMERVLALFTKDLVYRDVAMGVTNRGEAELRAFGERLFTAFPDITFEVRSSFTNGYRGTAEWIMRGTHLGDMSGVPATGKAIEICGVSVFEFDEDRIRCCSDYWDMARFLRDLDLMPTHPRKPEATGKSAD